MALTDLQVFYNEALGLLGEYQIEEGTPTTDKQYELCERYYARARQETLQAHPWNEAIKQAMILQEATAPLFGYDYKYAKPTDCLKVLSINEDVEHWEIQGNYILTDHITSPPEYDANAEEYVAGQYLSYNDVTYLVHTSFTSSSWAVDLAAYLTTQTHDYGYIRLEYIYDVTDLDVWTPKLRQAVALSLATKIAVAITGSQKVKRELIDEFESLVMPQARSIDAQQGRLKPIFDSQWIRSRS